MKAYKVTLLIIDHDEVGDGIKDEIENARYANRCIDPHVMDIESADIGEWSDDLPINKIDQMANEYKRIFKIDEAINALKVELEKSKREYIAAKIKRNKQAEDLELYRDVVSNIKVEIQRIEGSDHE